MREWLTLLPQASRNCASPSQSQDSEKQSKTKEICGLTPLTAFALYNHDTHSWRTSQVCLLPAISDEYTQTWPKQGIMLDGVCWELMIVEPHTGERDGGYLPTANAWDVKRGPGKEYNPKSKCQSDRTLTTYVKKGMWPTPSTQEIEHPEMDITFTGRRKTKNGKDSHSIGLADRVKWSTPQQRDWKGKSQRANFQEENRDALPNVIGGQLNPDFVEWLMGWQKGWSNAKGINEGWIPISCKEITKGLLREMWNDREFEHTPQGREFKKQFSRKYPDVVCQLSYDTSLGKWQNKATDNSKVLYNLWQAFFSLGIVRNSQDTIKETWQSLSCEEKGWIAMATIQGIWHSEWPNIPRVASGIKDRVNRLKAIGNGQVPTVVATAWEILSKNII